MRFSMALTRPNLSKFQFISLHSYQNHRLLFHETINVGKKSRVQDKATKRLQNLRSL